MSALARYFLSEGWQVSGSDISPSEITNALKKEGVKIFIGHQYSHIRTNRSITKIIYNQAITRDNPELAEAKKLGIPCQSYPEAVGELTKKYKTVAIAGAHGKSTTTGMVALTLIAAGFDPTVIIGTKLPQFKNKNFRKGNSEWLVLEADEFGGAFWHYFPAVAVITNIDKEHLDFYKNFTNVKKSFTRFKKQCGVVVSAVKDKKILANIKNVLKVPGDHNLHNASCAYAIAKHLGIPHPTILRGLSKYTGAWRRMEYRGILMSKSKGQMSKIVVYDDYAHHPTEIKATLAAFRQKWPKNALICVFQPHQEERLKRLFKEFIGAFKAADKVLILPTYKVAGRERGIRNQELGIKDGLAKKLAEKIDAVYLQNPKNLKKIIIKTIHDSRFMLHDSITVMMGAGNIVDYTDQLLS